MGVTKAVILVGGKATRLLPLTCNTPKAMVPVLNAPFLEHVIRYLRRYGITDITLAQSHLPEPITKYFGDGNRFDVKLNYVVEPSPLGTAGAFKNSEPYLSGTCLVLNGDIFTSLDIGAMIDFHTQRQAKVTIALTPVEDPTAYGLVETTTEGRITRFLEKPARDQITTNMINAGTYVIDTEVLSRIPPQTPCSFERELFPTLLKNGERVYAFPSKAYWIDIGTPEKYLWLQRELLNGNNSLYTKELENDNWISRSHIAPSAKIEGTVFIGDNCEIGANVRLIGPLTIGPGCTINKGTVIEDSILWHDVQIESGVVIRKSIVADHSNLKSGCRINGCILGDHVTVESGHQPQPGSRIWAGETVG